MARAIAQRNVGMIVIESLRAAQEGNRILDLFFGSLFVFCFKLHEGSGSVLGHHGASGGL
jgi:hypothetical protein